MCSFEYGDVLLYKCELLYSNMQKTHPITFFLETRQDVAATLVIVIIVIIVSPR